MSNRPHNAFLRRLSDASFSELASHLRPVELPAGTILYNVGDPISWVYFPESCLLSMMTMTEDGQSVETSMVGVEGACGLTEACGSGSVDLQCIVQVDGRALEAPADVVRRLVLHDVEFAKVAWAMVQVQLGESRQSGLCNAVHTVEHRLSRWLLESAERSGGRETLPLTQEFLSAMLGVQRTTVNGFAAQLQKHGLIAYRRGRITLLDVQALERHACECRVSTKAQRERLGFPVYANSLRPVRDQDG